MAEQNAHIINYKDKDGNWHAIPILVQDMYATYLSYCNAHGIDAVPKEPYLGALYSIYELAQAFANVSSEAVLTVAHGGTGAATIEGARAALHVYSTTEVDAANANIQNNIVAIEERLGRIEEALNTLREEFSEQINTLTPEKLGIVTGDFAPSETTEGSIYFEY